MENKTKNENTRKVAYAIAGVLFVVIAIVLVILFLLNGSVTKGDSSRTDIETESLSCESGDVEYPFFSFDESNKKSLKINMIFGEKRLDSLSLVYRLYYDDSDKISGSVAVNHADMNKSFNEDGLPVDVFGATYATLDDSMQMTLNASRKQINGATAKYFLLDEVTNYSKDNLKEHYESKGFKCKDNK